MYYKSKVTGAILNYPYDVDCIYGEGFAETLIDRGLLEKCPEPTIEDCIKYGGSKVVAVKRYREIHDCTLREAKDAIDELMKDIKPVKLSEFNINAFNGDHRMLAVPKSEHISNPTEIRKY